LFPDNSIHTTELLESPLNEGNNTVFIELTHIYVGILNYYDLIISKLFRGDGVDIEDCLMLFRYKKGEINMDLLKKRFSETAEHDVSEDKVKKNLEFFIKKLKKENLYEG